jgi:hypothetical protein
MQEVRRMSDNDTVTTTDHDEIRAWAEARGGEPAAVRDTIGDGKKGVILRIRFQEEDDLARMEWDKFFDVFETNGLAAILQKTTADGDQSRFVRFVNR